MTAQLDVALDRPLPMSVDAERAVLGSVLWSGSAYWRIANLIAVEDFFKESHRLIFAAIKRLAEAGACIDLLTVTDELKKKTSLDAAGGSAYVSSLVDRVPDVANIDGYVAIVVRHAKLRRLIVAGNAMMRAAMDVEAEPEEIAAGALRDLSALSNPPASQSRPLVEIVRELYAEQERILAGETKSVDVIETGYERLDLHRAIRRTFGVIGSPSNHGKTAMMVNLANDCAKKGYRVAIFSLESTEREVGWRYVATEGQIAHVRAQDWRYLRPSDSAGLAVAERHAAQRTITVCRDIRSVDGIVAECRRLQIVGGLDIAFVDYIQLVENSRQRWEREDLRHGATAQTFLRAALEMRIGIYATSQLNEDRGKRDGGRLHQGDLKHAKAIGESARVVLMFQRPHADDKAGTELPCRVDFQIEKNNEGTTGDYQWHFDEKTQTFREGSCDENKCRHAKAPAETSLFER